MWNRIREDARDNGVSEDIVPRVAPLSGVSYRGRSNVEEAGLQGIVQKERAQVHGLWLYEPRSFGPSHYSYRYEFAGDHKS